VRVYADRETSAELARIRNVPTDTELAAQIDETESKVRVLAFSPVPAIIYIICDQVAKLRAHLEPLRAGTPLVSAAELDALDTEWSRWRAEWTRRKKVFYKWVLRVSFSLCARDIVPHNQHARLTTPSGVKLLGCRF
jgi:26S proteasome regulatory subunit, ATPase 3, interacting protein